MKYSYKGRTEDDVEILLDSIDLSYEFENWIHESYDKEQLIDFLFEGWVVQDFWERFYDEVLEHPEMVGVKVEEEEE